MSAPAVIRFPPPPPTRNELSSEQRAKLIRTNNKLGQVLGSTPHVLDLSYTVAPAPHTELPAPPKTPTSSRNPFRGHARKKSSPKADLEAMRKDATSPDSVASRRSTSSVRVKTDELAWRTPYSVQRPPLLKLLVPSSPSPSRSRKPNLDTIPGSPTYEPLASAPIEPPTFYIPSDAAMRREKMRRVRKMLGDGVPHDLVFPSSPEESESEDDSPLVATPTSTMSREWLLVDTNKPLPTPAELSKPLPVAPSARAEVKKKAAKENARRDRLYKERPKDKPSRSVQRLESIEENAKEAKHESLTVVGVSASLGMHGRGKSRRFIQGDVPFDQIGTAWGGHMW
ncbi:hypothetical protein BD309DRAFT_948459 [Dichomitus squalens]|uniref:Uncharacterized protein n=1 Tax=Dichomitus squalens TaxID=114155 RepID=A0A4Q9MLJ6_9APHY|nr:uncharacterized protein DICSQDRAFT_134342 [Dichomitus squalens LYAD-421 SS1]EJF63739.1 hypothetical protein DICSQDRAFT_134342 [Dichomitus squalens LYAD-421 SS1]TBU28500.1 hypothetical protein BD311DRAFT_778249 [Dichomitus squalens]TBU48923.1 hypothetical protein BD309DRAFT_948459 [Dichomitus squalens]TBU59313.1 hypothetical protein BD310DRAFT_419708 [Dichomitus squalens]